MNVCLGGINGFTRFFFHGFTGSGSFIGSFGGDFFRFVDSFTGFFFHGFTGSSSFVGSFAGNFFCFVSCGSGGFFHVFGCGSGGFFALVFGFIRAGGQNTGGGQSGQKEYTHCHKYLVCLGKESERSIAVCCNGTTYVQVMFAPILHILGKSA